MATYTQKQWETNSGRWKGWIKYDLPDITGCKTSNRVEFDEATEQELSEAMTEIILIIQDNK